MSAYGHSVFSERSAPRGARGLNSRCRRRVANSYRAGWVMSKRGSVTWFPMVRSIEIVNPVHWGSPFERPKPCRAAARTLRSGFGDVWAGGGYAANGFCHRWNWLHRAGSA
jgi:hypothetical protein